MCKIWWLPTTIALSFISTGTDGFEYFVLLIDSMALHYLDLFLPVGGSPSLPLSFVAGHIYYFLPLLCRHSLYFCMWSFCYIASHGSVNCSRKTKTVKSWDLELHILPEHRAQRERSSRKPWGKVQHGIYRERAGARSIHSIKRCYTYRTWRSWELRPLSALLTYLGRLHAVFSTLSPGLSWGSIVLIMSLSFKNTFSNS